MSNKFKEFTSAEFAKNLTRCTNGPTFTVHANDPEKVIKKLANKMTKK